MIFFSTVHYPGQATWREMVDKALDVEAILAGAKPSVAVTTEVSTLSCLCLMP